MLRMQRRMRIRERRRRRRGGEMKIKELLLNVTHLSWILKSQWAAYYGNHI